MDTPVLDGIRKEAGERFRALAMGLPIGGLLGAGVGGSVNALMSKEDKMEALKKGMMWGAPIGALLGSGMALSSARGTEEIINNAIGTATEEVTRSIGRKVNPINLIKAIMMKGKQ